jgi:hypothetical protein
MLASFGPALPIDPAKKGVVDLQLGIWLVCHLQ